MIDSVPAIQHFQPLKTIEWVGDENGVCRIVDQTLLPTELRYLDITSVGSMWEAIKVLRVRGAPAIGIAAAFGLFLAARAGNVRSYDQLSDAITTAATYLATSRPTAVNLFWAIDRIHALVTSMRQQPVSAIVEAIRICAVQMIAEDNAVCRAIGLHAQLLVPGGSTWLTHCNAGGLATAQWGTALAPFYIALEQGKLVHVFVDETRPLLQGARITAFELQRAGIPVTLIADNMTATVMSQGRVQAVIVGTDRVTANGDFANKIGTLGVAVLAKEFNLPFYVAAPTSSIDLSRANGGLIPIEERHSNEVTHGFGRQTAPDNIQVYNPAFDVTPAKYVTAFITEHGIIRPPFEAGLTAAVQRTS